MTSKTETTNVICLVRYMPVKACTAFRVQRSGFRVQGAEFRVQGRGIRRGSPLTSDL
jgi:hypothetical protein